MTTVKTLKEHTAASLAEALTPGRDAALNEYGRKELVRLAGRDNNTKRPWLLVNPLQGKHIPCSPTAAFDLFSALASQLYEACRGERLLIIGFAETATAIGAAIAACSPAGTAYIPTTRETIEGEDYLYFSESHSHATEQKLVRRNLRAMLSEADRVVFAEDEVTTGNTILNAIAAIDREFSDLGLRYGVVSILNGMSMENRAVFQSRGIFCTYLVQLNHETYADQIARSTFEPQLCYDFSGLSEGAEPSVRALTVEDYKNLRLGVSIEPFLSRCTAMTKSVQSALGRNSLEGQDVLVLGTEEFMFPPLCLAAYLEQACGCRSVRFHATTRSPILPSSDEGYPIFARFRLRSVYDPERTTYIYNLKNYDKVIIVHDSCGDSAPGLSDLCAALSNRGCGDISIVKWG